MYELIIQCYYLYITIAFSDYWKLKPVNGIIYRDSMKMRFSSYKIVEELYSSNEFSLYRVVCEKDNVKVLIKKIKDTPLNRTLIQNEIKLLKEVELKSSVFIKEYFYEYDSIFCVLEDNNYTTLRKYLMNNKPDLNSIINIILGIISALEELFINGIIHRGINLDSIFMYNKMNIKISNFLFSSNTPNYYINTLHDLSDYLFISPEQSGFFNRSVTYLSDIYSLGLIFYYMVTGMIPYEDDDKNSILKDKLKSNFIAPSELDDKIPCVISKIIMKMLEKEPDKRYRNISNIKKDLIHSLLNSNERTYEVGLNDNFSTLFIPEKIYGRENEKKIIADMFNNVLEKKQLNILIIQGESGIGKTVLIDEMKEYAYINNGLYIKIKCDQFINRSKPFYTISHIFLRFFDKIKKLNNSEQIKIIEQLKSVISINGKILTDIVPEYEELIGKQPVLTILSSNENKTRFNMVIENLFEYFISINENLLIFIDDIQWIDLDSFNIFNNIGIFSFNKSIFFIFSYNNYYIDELGFLKNMIFDFEHTKTGALVNEIEVVGLKEVDIQNMLFDIFNIKQNKSSDEIENIKSLAYQIYKSTKGNPFLSKEMLKLMYDKGGVSYINTSKFEDSIQCVNGIESLMNVVVDNMMSLPENLIMIIKYCSCFENGFFIEDIKKITDIEEFELQSLVDNLLNLHIITYDIQLSKYKITNLLIKERIQKLFSSDFQEINYKIYKTIESKNDDENLVKTNYMLKCRELIKNQEDKSEIIHFILKSAETYKNMNQFQMASECYKFALNIMYNGNLDENIISMYIEIIKIEFYSKKFIRTDDYLLLINNFFNNQLTHNATALTLLNLTRKMDYSGVATIVQNIFGKELVISDMEVIKIFYSRSSDDFDRLPGCTESEIIDKIETLNASLFSFAEYNHLLFYNSLKKIVYLSLFYGVTQYSFFAFYIFNLYFAYQLNDTINEVTKEKIAAFQEKLLNIISNNLESEKKLIDYYTNNIDFNYYNNFHLIIYDIFSMIFKPGFTTAYAIELCTYLSSSIDCKNNNFKQLEILQAFMLKLSGFRNEDYIKSSCSFSYFFDFVHHYFTDELIFEQFSYKQLNIKWDNCIDSLLLRKQYNFFKILVLCKIFNGAGGVEKKSIYCEIKEISKWFNEYADTWGEIESNIMKIIIDGELARIDNNYYTAILLYEKAIDLSHRSDLILLEAISQNIAGIFYQRIAKPILAKEHHDKSAVLFYRMGISTTSTGNNDFRILSVTQNEMDMNRVFTGLQNKGITNHEYRVIKLIEEGKSNKDIGIHLFIAEPTVKKHITNIFKKLNIKNRYELISLMKQQPELKY